MICLSCVNLSIQINATSIVYWTIPGCWLKWILGYFLFSVGGIEPLKDGLLGVFFGGTTKLWRDRLRWNHVMLKKTPMCHYDPSINVYHHFWKKLSFFHLSLWFTPFAAFFQLWPPTQHVKNGYNQYWRKNPAASVESKVLDPHQFTPSLVFEIKESRDVLKAIRFEMLRTKALQGHIYPCSHVHGRILPFHDYLSLTWVVMRPQAANTKLFLQDLWQIRPPFHRFCHNHLKQP